MLILQAGVDREKKQVRRQIAKNPSNMVKNVTETPQMITLTKNEMKKKRGNPRGSRGQGKLQAEGVQVEPRNVGCG